MSFHLSPEDRNAIRWLLNEGILEDQPPTDERACACGLVAGVLRRLLDEASSAISMGPKVPSFVMDGLLSQKDAAEKSGRQDDALHLGVAIVALDECGLVSVPSAIHWDVRDAIEALDHAGVAWAWEDEADAINNGAQACVAKKKAAVKSGDGATMEEIDGVATTFQQGR